MEQERPTYERIGPARGIVFAQTARGRKLSAPDIERWVRLVRTVYKCDKIDVILEHVDCGLLRRIGAFAAGLDARISLRTPCSVPPPQAAHLRDANLFDVFLCPARADAPEFDAWLQACRDIGLPVRVQVCAPFEYTLNAAAFAECASRANVITIAADDPFTGPFPARNDVHSRVSVEKAVEIARAALMRGVETNLVGFPFCVMPEDLWPNVVDRPQFFLDHQQYKREPFELAAALYRRRPAWVRQVVLMKLGQYTSTNNPIDRILLPWIMDRPWVRARVWALHKVTRHRKSALPATPAEAELEAERVRDARRRARGPVCGTCRLQRICDGVSRLERRLPGLAIVAQPGQDVLDPFEFAREQRKYYDAMDTARRDLPGVLQELAHRANAIVTNTPPSREIDSFDYRVDGTWSWQLPGSVRWFSFVGGEKLSTPVARLDPPFTLSVTFGGGVAEYIGFAIGRACRLLCPMTAYTHRVVLHVEQDGRYVLLRDGQPVRPVEFVGSFYAPPRLGKGLEPRIAAWNIDGTLGTQAVYLWEEAQTQSVAKTFRASVVIVSTRYSRRLQACLNNLAHQRGVPLDEIEAVVAFVPGLDATNDVIDSIQLAHPGLTVVPAPFAPEFANTKGLMLNECLDKARGEWVMVLDADILLAPDMLARLTALPADCKFAVPDGRKMLTRETTARVLLGEVKPWESWDELLAGAGEYRMREADGVPVGYCQCVRRECLEKVRYEELHHFEGADWKFGKDMRDHYGVERRLDGVPVLHLDHGGSNWYGATRHY